MTDAQPATGFVDVPGAQLYYEAVGTGPALVMVHAGIANLRMWDAQAAALSSRYRVIRYDTRGFGRSRTLDDRLFANYDDLAAVMDHVEVKRAHMLGCSRGGMITLDFMLEHPERALSLTWVCSGVSGLEYTPTDADAHVVAIFAQMEAAYEAKDLERLNELEAQVWVEGPGQPDGRADPQVRQQVLEMNRLNIIRDDPDLVAKKLEPPAIGRLAEVKVPVLVIIGDLDMPDSLAAADYMEQHVAGARKVVFHGTAHVPSLERPEEFNRVVGEFLDSV
ncbi:MAG: alpha/beta fold hydrolase [Chloroflexales bacterium]|nr:alpha/beta fold hydrolase [Chloroflexales bacterium]